MLSVQYDSIASAYSQEVPMVNMDGLRENLQRLMICSMIDLDPIKYFLFSRHFFLL